MTWLRLDDSIASHTKVLRAGPEAAWLWVCCIAYSTRHLTDGFVPSEALVTLGNFRNLSGALAKARDVRLLDDRDGGVCVHHYLEHNPSAEQVRARLAELAELARRGGKASAAKRSGQPARSSAPVEPARSSAPVEPARSSAPLNVDPLPSSPLRSSPGEVPARAREDLIEDEGGQGTRIARIAKWHSDAMRTTRGSRAIVPDLGGAAVCAPVLATLNDADAEAVVRAFVADADPWLADRLRRWALRWLTADRVNRYLTPEPAEADVPRRHQITAAEIEALDTPPEPPEGWSP